MGNSTICAASTARINGGRGMSGGDKMFYKIERVKPLPNYVLLVKFENNTEKIYDVKPLFDKWEEFKPLMSIKGLFEQVKVDVGGYGVIWNDNIDLSCNEIWESSTIVEAVKI